MLAELARGGMGIVHLAESRGPGGFEKLVVVKELKAELADDPVYCAMFLDEARLAARLSHRHIVQTNEVGCENGRYFMALELLEGGSLHQIRTKLGLRALPTLVGVRILVAVLDALHHAHELTDSEGSALGVVHRDVSAQNVFLTFDGGVKLIDFGVAKSKDRRGAAITRVGVVKGSVPYMSPDHVDGNTIDRRADVFAAGVILRELLCGERLWGDADDLTILRALIARDLPPFPPSADAPDALRAIVAKAMAPRRADRYATAAAMRDALEGYLAAHDPRGSLDDLGTWLERNLAEERLAFRALVKTSRAATVAAGKPGTKAEVWLPSCELSTRYSGPPVLPALPPPLPAATSATAMSGRARLLASSAALVAMLGIAALGAARAKPDLPNATVASTTVAAHRMPRVVDSDVKVSLDTSVRAEAPDADDIAETTAVVGEPSAARARASILDEPLPPNPYVE
ncbi:MAG: serine/threonine protein kinase [Myxococcaceae bacterium]|nr:serine/threonine protein kinase [Myxococcaceae bacterium]